MRGDPYPIGTVVVTTRPNIANMTEGVVVGRDGKNYVLQVMVPAVNSFPNPPVGATSTKNLPTLDNYYRIKETPTMNDRTINIGDVFVGDRNRTFAELRVTDKVFGYVDKWRCRATRHDGSTTTSTIYASTLLTRYSRKSLRDFNVDALAYERPMRSKTIPAKDIPLVPTRPIRENDAYRFLTTDTATLIHVGSDGVRQAKGQAAKRELLLNAEGGTMLLAVPGVYSMDAFYIDDRSKALGVLGLVKHEPTPTPQPRTAADGSQWVAA